MAEHTLSIRQAVAADTDLIFDLIAALADYEKLAHAVVVTPAELREALFGAHPSAEVLIAEVGRTAVGFALFFHNFSTFLGKKGLFLEDLFVQPAHRGCGYGKALMIHLAQIALARNCGRFEWNVLDWNEPAIHFYRSIGAVGMDEWRTQRVTGSALIDLSQRKS